VRHSGSNSARQRAPVSVKVAVGIKEKDSLTRNPATIAAAAEEGKIGIILMIVTSGCWCLCRRLPVGKGG
jgi:hypothetical protein